MDGLFDKLQGSSDECGPDDGITVPGLLELPDDLRHVFTMLTRMGRVTAAQLSARLNQDVDDVRGQLHRLVKQNVVCELPGDGGEPVYRSRIARKRRSRMSDNMWDLLEDCPDES